MSTHAALANAVHVLMSCCLHVQVQGKHFHVLLTTYEMLMGKLDRPRLSKHSWQCIVIDEGHRLKNANCKLNAELKMYRSTSRLLLTGTCGWSHIKCTSAELVAVCCTGLKTIHTQSIPF